HRDGGGGRRRLGGPRWPSTVPPGPVGPTRRPGGSQLRVLGRTQQLRPGGSACRRFHLQGHRSIGERVLEMIEALILALWRGYIRLLRTDKEHVGVAERIVRGLLVVVPYYAVAALLLIRAAVWRPVTVDSITEDG